MNTKLINAFVGELDSIPYRKELRTICGSVTASILFQQLLYRSKGKGHEPFYKFKEPCKHEAYRQGDSWTEELGFSVREFDSALKNIAQRVKSGEKKDPKAFFWYWISQDRKTFYQANLPAIEKALDAVFLNDKSADRKNTKAQIAKQQNRVFLNDKSADRYITENTTEKTQREGTPAQNSEYLIAKDQSFNNTAPSVNPQYLDLFAEVAKEVDPITAERAALLFSTNSQNVEAGIRKLKAAKMNPAEIISDFLLNPKYKNYNVFDLQAQFQRSAGVYARIENNNRPQVGARNGRQPVSSSARLPRY